MARDKCETRLPVRKARILLTHFIVSNDIERAKYFYSEVLGGEVVHEGKPTMIALANCGVTINDGLQ